MKLIGAIFFALLMSVGGVGVFADGFRQGGDESRESAGRPEGNGVVREHRSDGVGGFERRENSRDRDAPRAHGRDREHERFSRQRGFVAVPIIVAPGYYDSPPLGYVDQPPQYFEEDGNYFWYYCPDLGYYPNVQTCPTEWLKVVPNTP